MWADLVFVGVDLLLDLVLGAAAEVQTGGAEVRAEVGGGGNEGVGVGVEGEGVGGGLAF